MAYGQEETVDRQIIFPLISLTLAMHQMSSLHTILTIESKCVGFKQNLNLFGKGIIYSTA